MFVSLFTIICLWGNIDFAKIFGADYQKAVDFSIQHQKGFAEKADQYQVPAQALNSIVFPELIRHSSFQDFFETKALELAYVAKGSTWADFSIGNFQMKPSFVEKLEAQIKKEDVLKEPFKQLIQYQEVGEKEIRQARLERMKSLDWQMDYLCCFYVLVRNKFANGLEGQNEEFCLKFIATAYNFGFEKSFEDIQKWTQKASYPYGSKYPESQQYNYSEVAWDYYKKTK